MKRLRWTKILALLAFAAGPATAQEREARVLEPGQLRIDLGANYFHIDSRFGATGTIGISGEDGLLSPARFAALQVPAEAVDAFLALTAPQGTDAAFSGDDLLAGELIVDDAITHRSLPIRLAVGILPRVELGVSLPLVRTDQLTRRLDMSPGNVGANPDPVRNATILEELGPAGTALGSSQLLPVEGSPLGQELQHRSQALTGELLTLPAEPLTLRQLVQSHGLLSAGNRIGAWHPGDLEIDGRVELLRSFSGALPAVAGEVHYRLMGTGGYRIPAGFLGGEVAESSENLGFGYRGPRIGAAGDLFLGPSWTSIGARFARLSRESERSDGAAGDVADGFPGDELDLWLLGRLRLTGEVSIGGGVRSQHWSGGQASPAREYEDGSLTSLDFSIRYSALGEGTGSPRSIEAATGFSTAIRGTEGVARPSRAFLQISILTRLWGG